MKRILLMIMLFGILLSTVGCSQPAVTQPKDLPTRPSEPSASANLAIVSMQGGAGADVLLEYTPASEEQIAFIDLPSLPRYINPYPSGQGGPEYTMTQDLTQRIHDNLRHYLELWDSTLDVSALEFTTDADWEYACNYEADDFSALSWVNCITLQVEESGIDGSSGEEELLNEPTLQAALAYLEWEDVAVEQSVEYKLDGSVYHHNWTIFRTYEDSTEQMLQKSFTSIELCYFDELNSYTLKIITHPDLVEDGEAVLPADTLSGLQALYPNATAENTTMEIAYTAYAEPGYFIPCYRFYVREHDDPDLCTVIEAVPTA